MLLPVIVNMLQYADDVCRCMVIWSEYVSEKVLLLSRPVRTFECSHTHTH